MILRLNLNTIMNVAIIWGSTTGNTQSAADLLAIELAELGVSCYHVDKVTNEEMLRFDVVLIGVSTWDIGELQYDWSDRIDGMAEHDGSKVQVGFFGCGDAVGYDDTFVDAFGIIWEKLEPRGAKLIGKWPVEGYDFTKSRSLCDSDTMFLGLPLDDDNEPELTEGRVADWATQIRSEISSTEVAAP